MPDHTAFDTKSAIRIGNAVIEVENRRRNLVPTPPKRKPTFQSTIIIEIIDAGATDGFYRAKQKIWNGTSFIDITGGRTWDGVKLPLIFEVNGTTGIAAGTIATATSIGNTTGGFQWIIVSSIAATTIFPVKVTSGGPGDTYVIEVFADGSDQPATETGKSLKIMQIESSQTIPAGTFLLATKIGETFYGQVAVWL